MTRTEQSSKIQWRNVLIAATLMTALTCGGVWVAEHVQSPADPLQRFGAHLIPMDYADENVRAGVESLLSEYQMRIDVEPVLRACDASKELYRLKTIPGFVAQPVFRVIDLTISGNTARLIRREFQIEPSPAAWREVSNVIVTRESADVIRDAAIGLLNSKIPVYDGVPPPDVGEWTVEMCWHGRYHLFQRHVLGVSRDEPFTTYASRLADLH